MLQMRMIQFGIDIKLFMLFIALYFNTDIVNSFGMKNEWYNSDGGVVREHLDWMRDIPDSLYLYSLSIPGTHDTIALYGGDLVECQSMNLNHQLRAGIRALDIRCRHYDNSFIIHHGIVYQKANFDDVLHNVTNFLKNHPKEVILMRVREEYKEYDVTQSFADTFKDYINKPQFSPFIWSVPIPVPTIGTQIPTIGEVRGKIVILVDFSGGDEYGLLWNSFNIQDDYKVPTLFNIDEKEDKVIDQLKKSENDNENWMFVNFLSGSSGGAYPYDIAKKVNHKIYDYLKDSGGKTGVMYMDFPGDGLITRIIIRNPRNITNTVDYLSESVYVEPADALLSLQKLHMHATKQLYDSLRDSTKRSKDSLENIFKQLKNQQTTIQNHELKLIEQQLIINNLQENSVPLGFIYVQLAGQPEPSALWSQVEWSEVSSDYAGLFFRVVGGNSLAFGSTQEENILRITDVRSSTAKSGDTINLIPGWSASVFTGDGTSDFKYLRKQFGLNFNVSSGEVRPRNQAVRIWKRTN